MSEVLPEPLPAGVADKLGIYVYALRDPWDRSIFYVGKGKGDRVFSHVWAAMGRDDKIKDGLEQESVEVQSAKYDRIRKIYAAGKVVEHFILRHRIEVSATGDKAAFAIEQAMIDLLRLTETASPPVLTNSAGGHKETEWGVMAIGELVKQYAAVPAPPIEKPAVVIVTKNAEVPALSSDELYERIRGTWYASKVPDIPDIPIYIVHRHLIRAVYRASAWEPSPDKKKWIFIGTVDDELEKKYVGKTLKPANLNPPLKGWSTRGWHPILGG